MSSIPLGVLFVVILFGSAVAGMVAANYLPEHHLNPETKSVVSVSTAVLGTLAALVVGLLISTANTSFTDKANEVTNLSVDVISLDRLLRRYGPEAGNARSLLRRYAAAKYGDLFPNGRKPRPNLENDTTLRVMEELQSNIVALTPANEEQRWLGAQALQVTAGITAGRWRLGQEDMVRTPARLVILVLFWFAVIFASFGLFAPRNMTSVTAIFLCAVGIGSAVRMTTELERPFSGLIRVPSAPLAQALQVIGR